MDTNHLIATAHENGYCPCVGAFLDDEHLVSCRAEGNFANDTRFAQLFWCQVLKSWYNATVGSDGNQLN